jgi:hypothetical protein
MPPTDACALISDVLPGLRPHPAAWRGDRGLIAGKITGIAMPSSPSSAMLTPQRIRR